MPKWEPKFKRSTPPSSPRTSGILPKEMKRPKSNWLTPSCSTPLQPV
ncbi:hypothetical protein HMPREF1556_00033 [Porphyromonas sp. oral taxon 278 str. W7784]|nr:hypothetical protein HMPREF1556_00033 [Porphyromonas sp. oral taxon 278 str. W7784]